MLFSVLGSFGCPTHPSRRNAMPTPPTTETPLVRRLIAPSITTDDDNTAAWTFDGIMKHTGKLLPFDHRYGLVIFLANHLQIHWDKPSEPDSAGTYAPAAVPTVVCAMAAMYMLAHHAGEAGRTVVAELTRRPDN